MPAADTAISWPPPAAATLKGDRRLEMRLWLFCLLLANLGLLLANVPADNLMYQPAAVAAGDWWRLFTWPWVHVSRYHLVLDAAAFLLLYHGLEAPCRRRRLGYLVAAVAGSLLLPLLCAPEIGRLGLCGLSGPTHGLMAVSALELRTQGRQKRLGACLFGGLLAKTAWELATGTAFLQGWHFGDIGQPIVTTHAGGIIGALTVFGYARGRG